MTKRYSIVETGIQDIVDEVEAGNTVELTRSGEPVAILLPVADYKRLTQGRPEFWDAYQEVRREFDLTGLGIDPDEVFRDVRDPSPGRGFSW